MKSIESHVTLILTLTLLAASAWALLSFIYGHKLLPGEVDLSEVFFEATTACMVFLGFGISITLRINKKFKRLINTGFFLLFIAVFQDLLDELMTFDNIIPGLIEDLGIPLGFLLLGLGLFGLSRESHENFDRIQDLQKHKQQLTTTDALTQLISRQEFIRQLPTLQESIEGDRPALIALRLYIDNLKSINGDHGYFIGDTILREVATQLQNSKTNHWQSIVRLQGREFMILLRGLSLKEATQERGSIVKKISKVVVNNKGNSQLFYPDINYKLTIIDSDESLYLLLE